MGRYEIRDGWLEGETFNCIRLSVEAIEYVKEALRDGVALVAEWESGDEVGTVRLDEDDRLIVETTREVKGLPAMGIAGTIECDGEVGRITVTDVSQVHYFMTDGESGAWLVGEGEG